MNNILACKENTCPKCGMGQNTGEVCASCGLIFAKYRPPVSTWSLSSPPDRPAQSKMTDINSAAATFGGADCESGYKVDIITIIALIMLIDSTLSLLARVPTIDNMFSISIGFHQKAKFLYDLLMAVCMFASALGLLLRREWARVSMIAVLALGLAEGLYMLVYLHFTVTGLEKDLYSDSPDLKANTTGKWLGCALYTYFIVTLNSSKTKSGFSSSKKAAATSLRNNEAENFPDSGNRSESGPESDSKREQVIKDGNGRLIIRKIADAKAAERVVAFLCAKAKNTTPEATAARLEKLPLVLTKSIKCETGRRIAQLLTDLGADAVFIPDAPPADTFTSPQQTPMQALEALETTPPLQVPPAKKIDKGAPPVKLTYQQEQVKLSSGKSAIVKKDKEHLLQIAYAQKLLIWGVVAAMSPLISPVLYVLAIPFQLYTIYRISRALKFGTGFAAVCVVIMLIPLLGLILLLVLNSRATKALKAANISVGLAGARQKDLKALGGTPETNYFGPAFTGVILLVGMIGVSTGRLPAVMPDSKQSIENRLESEARKVNKDLPKQIDADTRADRVTAGPGKRLTFNYTLLKYPASSINEDEFRETMIDRVKQESCGNKGLTPLFREGVSIDYSYSGNDGNPVTNLTVKPTDCGV